MQGDLDPEMRSDSEYDPAAAGAAAAAAAAAAGAAAGGDAASAVDLLAALRNPDSSALTQLLAGGLLTAPPGKGAGGDQLGSMLGQLLLQQEQRLEAREREQQQPSGGLGLNLNVLLPGGGNAAGGGSGLHLFTGAYLLGAAGDVAALCLTSFHTPSFCNYDIDLSYSLLITNSFRVHSTPQPAGLRLLWMSSCTAARCRRPWTTWGAAEAAPAGLAAAGGVAPTTGARRRRTSSCTCSR